MAIGVNEAARAATWGSAMESFDRNVRRVDEAVHTGHPAVFALARLVGDVGGPTRWATYRVRWAIAGAATDACSVPSE